MDKSVFAAGGGESGLSSVVFDLRSVCVRFAFSLRSGGR